MAALTPQSTAVVGTALTAFTPTASTGDTVPPLSSTVIVHNASGASINVTITTPGNDQYGLARPDIVTAVAAGAKTKFGPFQLDLADPSTTPPGQVTLVCSATASVSLHVLAED